MKEFQSGNHSNQYQLENPIAIAGQGVAYGR